MVNITANNSEAPKSPLVVAELKKSLPEVARRQENSPEENVFRSIAPAAAPKHKAQRVPVSISSVKAETTVVPPASGRSGNLVRGASTVGGARRVVKGSLPPSSFTAREDQESNSNISRPSKLKPSGLARATSVSSIRGKAASPEVVSPQSVHKGSTIPRPISMVSRLPGPSGGLRRVGTVVGKTGTKRV